MISQIVIISLCTAMSVAYPLQDRAPSADERRVPPPDYNPIIPPPPPSPATLRWRGRDAALFDKSMEGVRKITYNLFGNSFTWKYFGDTCVLGVNTLEGRIAMIEASTGRKSQPYDEDRCIAELKAEAAAVRKKQDV